MWLAQGDVSLNIRNPTVGVTTRGSLPRCHGLTNPASKILGSLEDVDSEKTNNYKKWRKPPLALSLSLGFRMFSVLTHPGDILLCTLHQFLVWKTSCHWIIWTPNDGIKKDPPNKERKYSRIRSYRKMKN